MATVAVFKGKEKVDLQKFVEEVIPIRMGCSFNRAYDWWDYIAIFTIGALMHSGGIRLTESAFRKHAKRVKMIEQHETVLYLLLVVDYRMEAYG